VKITGLTDTVRSLYLVKSKDDNQNTEQRQQNADSGKKDGEKKSFENRLEATQENVDAAVDAFKVDQQTQANGLSADVIGQGPGLKVILKDGSGAVIRQFTGEEFLKLREASTQQGAARGKILDQKL
jgi:hypothetical protein